MTQIGATMRRVFLAASILAAATASARQPATAKAGPTLIKNATVLTVTKGRLENTDVLLQNGKIAQLGKNLSAPAGANVIDATGKYVMPGIIDPHSHTMIDAVNESEPSLTASIIVCEWGSMMPGMTYLPVASMTFAPAGADRFLPSCAIFPFCSRTSVFSRRPLVTVRTVAFL